MPLESPATSGFDRLGLLQRSLEGLSAIEVLEAMRAHPATGRVALASSFGAEAVVLLHMISRIDPRIPVLFLDTELLFPETLAYQAELSSRLRLENIITLRAGRKAIFERDPDNMLSHFNPDACCHLRKTEPLETALAGFDSWITGRKRFHGGQRTSLPLLEFDGTGRIKINPLFNWRPSDIADYRAAHDLPAHPLASRGYTSIGCRPCTRPRKAGEAPREGRWGGMAKTECGIHLIPQLKGVA